MRFGRVFHFFLCATALWGFLALVSTGQMHLPVVVVSLPLMVLPMTGVARRVQMSPYVWTFLTLLAFVAALLNILVMHEVMYSLVYFFLFLEITKLWTLRQNRDVFQVLILSFFQMVAASVMTAAISFAAMFIGYMFLVTVTWMLFSIKREADGVSRGVWRKRRRKRRMAGPAPVPILEGAGNGAEGLQRARIVNWSFLYGSVWLTLVLIVGTAGVFLLIPRLSSQRFLSGFQLMRPERISGLSDQVDFSTLGNIQLDPTVIARVQLTAGRHGLAPPNPGYLRLRATSLDSYTGMKWKKSRLTYETRIPSQSSDYTLRDNSPEGTVLHQDIFLEPGGSNYLFGASMPIRFRFGHVIPVLFDPNNSSIMALRDRSTAIRYRVDSMVPENASDLLNKSVVPESRLLLTANALAEVGRDTILEAVRGRPILRYPHGRRERRRPLSNDRFMQFLADRFWYRVERTLREGLYGDSGNGNGLRLLPELQDLFTRIPDIPDMDSVRRLAGEWTKDDATPLAKARRIEHLLQTRFTYTTDVEVKDPEFHMTEFLTDSRKGNCEYFASAMALMLRSLDIPARIVTGYYTDDYNEAGGYFMVRRQDAHTWVETWINPFGWVTFDPTPPSGVWATRHAFGFFASVQRYLDAFRFYWYRHVIDFDLQDQFRLARAASTWKLGLSRSLEDFLRPMRDGTRALSLRARGVSPGRGILFGLCLLIASIVAWFLGREVLGLVRRPGAKKGIPRVVIRRQIAYYLEILHTLAALQFRKESGQTPWEFAQQVVAIRNDWEDFLPVTRAYYNARFRSGDVTNDDLQRARAFMERIRSGKTE